MLDTPLGIACGRGGKPELILLLVKGGAHLYFRGKDGLTPIHRASIGGNTEAIKTLLGLGASPNYRDAKVQCGVPSPPRQDHLGYIYWVHVHNGQIARN